MTFTQEHLAGRPDLIRSLFAEAGIQIPGTALRGTIRHRAHHHNDRNPSLSYDLELGLYNCHGCDESGDVVSAYAAARGLEVPDAIREICERYRLGGNGNGRSARPSPTPPPTVERPDAAAFWQSLAAEDDEGIEYLRSRNLWPLPDGLARFAKNDPLRIAVPLYDAEGSIVNVQRRKAVDRENIVGSAFTSIKGVPVKGTSFGKIDRDAEVWIVEGLTDFLAASALTTKRIALGAPGAKNAGHLVRARADQLRGRSVFVSFDNDAAGERATVEAVAALRAGGANPIVARYPEGFKDLAELVERRGADGAREVMAEVFAVALKGASEEGSAETGNPDSATRPSQPRWFVVGADEFCSMSFPEREYLLEPWFQEKNLALLYAPRGVGKTIVSAGIALAVSCGGQFLRWKAGRPRRVLYIDGELPQETLQKRLRDVAVASGLALTPHLRLLTPDLQPVGARLPNLANLEAQEAVEALIDEEDPDLIVLDNLSTLCRGGEENAAESWQIIQDWLILLRSRRRSVLLDHHSGKSGDQRGTSKREDVLDVSIRLTRPTDYQAEQGARFEAHFEKSRDPHGDAVAPFEAWLQGDAWTIKALAAALEEKMIRLAQEGLTTRQIAKEVDKHHATVARVLKKATADGRMAAAEDGS